MSIECSKILSSDSSHFRNVAILQCYYVTTRFLIKKLDFGFLKPKKHENWNVIEIEKSIFSWKRKNGIFMFVRFVVKRNFDIFRTFVSFEYHVIGHMIMLMTSQQSDQTVLDRVKWCSKCSKMGSECSKQSHLSYSNLFLWYFKKNDILKNVIPFCLKMGSGNLKLESPTENWLMRSLKVWEKVRVGTFNVELVMRLVGKLYR